VVAATDAAAQLVQLRQAEAVGAVDEDGVGGGDVDAGLDDGGAQQQVGALLGEVAHYALELALGELAVADDDACFGQQLLEVVAHVVDGVDLVVQEVHLAATLELAQHRLANQAAAGRVHEGLDREPLLRRGGDHRELAQALHRQAERARDRGGGQGQDVDLGAQLLERLLLAHAEAVLLIDDHQAEALEDDVLLQQAVGADDDVDLAFGH
jgi:hypothetical protein